MTERQTYVRRYACPACGRAFTFDRLNGPRLHPHSAITAIGVRVRCFGSGMLPERAKGLDAGREVD